MLVFLSGRLSVCRVRFTREEFNNILNMIIVCDVNFNIHICGGGGRFKYKKFVPRLKILSSLKFFLILDVR